MEKLNSVGFHNFWSVTPGRQFQVKKSILFYDNNDICNLLLTIQQKEARETKIYFNEENRENLARCLILFELINDCKLSITERTEMFLEIYGNSFVSSRTEEYLLSISKELVKFVTQDTRYKGPLNQIFDISELSYKDIDALVDVFEGFKGEFDIAKYRDDRLRYHYKERYDYRNNLIDADYHFNFKEKV